MSRLVTALMGCCMVVALNANLMAAEIKVLTAGAMKAVLLAVADEFQKATAHTLLLDNDTTGALAKRIEGGAPFDATVLPPAVLADLGKKGFVAGPVTPVARVGVGVVVKAGAPLPDISTVDAFKRTLLAAKSVAYIDPASGGSSGIYVAQMLERLGIADAIKPKAKLQRGGAVADLVASGEAEIGIHQISEILPVAGVTLVGPLPAELQNYTVYAAGVGASAKQPDAAKALIEWLAGPRSAAVLTLKGMDRPPS